ncbi:MAG: T9SS type A sorting domain-containing protein, partial [bacterium]|nr:T9SS type A sorting domain-containing protein [bacterium]
NTNNRISQGGGQQLSSPLVVPTPAPDLGAIILYVQTVGDDRTIRGQKINRDGERLWGDFGNSISTVLTNVDNLSGVPDGNGGAAFVYTAVDITNPFFYNVVRFQHVNANGDTLLPGEGVVVDSANGEQSFSSMTKSGNNYYVAFIELYDEINLYYAVRVAKINLDGSQVWLRTIAEGAVNNSTGNRQHVQLIPASNGGVVAYWQEYRSDSNNGGQIYAQKVNSDGTIGWTTGGIRLGASAEDQATATATITRSGNSYWFAWKDVRNAGVAQIYAQHINDAGQRQLATSGLHVNDMGTNVQQDPSVAMDNSNGVYLAWSQYVQAITDTIADAEIKGVHLSGTGAVLYPNIWSSPTPQNSGWWVRFTYKQLTPDIAPTVLNAAVGNWQDFRSTGKEELINLYGQRVSDPSTEIREITNSIVPSDYVLEQNWPNPFNSTTTFKFSLPNQENVKVIVYDVTGREVARLLDAKVQAGTYQVKWFGKNDAGLKVASGIYFYRLETKKATLTRKLALVN